MTGSIRYLILRVHTPHLYSRAQWLNCDILIGVSTSSGVLASVNKDIFIYISEPSNIMPERNQAIMRHELSRAVT